MFGFSFLNKRDCRRLLLDYSRSDNPMLKKFPTEGLVDIYYDFFENKLLYLQNDYVEL